MSEAFGPTSCFPALCQRARSHTSQKSSTVLFQDLDIRVAATAALTALGTTSCMGQGPIML